MFKNVGHLVFILFINDGYIKIAVKESNSTTFNDHQ